MSTAAGPRCPRCHRPLAAWRLEHCVYCGEVFPADLKQGHSEPEALKWVERPALPADVTKKLQLMKVVPSESRGNARNFVAIAALVSIPIFAVIFFLTYRMLQRFSPVAGFAVIVAGLGTIGYLAWIFNKARN